MSVGWGPRLTILNMKLRAAYYNAVRLLPLLLLTHSGRADTFVFNTDTQQLTVNGAAATTFKGLGFTMALNADGAMMLRTNPGNVALAATDRLSFRGFLGARLIVQGNLDIPAGCIVEADAQGATRGAGGGNGGSTDNTGGAGGARGGVTGYAPGLLYVRCAGARADTGRSSSLRRQATAASGAVTH